MTSEANANAVKQSIRMIETVMNDVAGHYPEAGGGGIIEIKMTATNVYRVSIAQEERVDIITYELAVGSGGSVTVKSRTNSTKSH